VIVQINSPGLETYLQLVLKQVLLVGELAVEAEQLGLIRRHFLCGTIRFDC
jgi:hypothetical protein